MHPKLDISYVWKKITPELQQEIVNFWMSNNMLKPETNPLERSTQVVLTVRHNNKIVGLTSADFVRFHQLNDNLFYLFRMIVLPEFRIPGIESKLIVETRDHLEAFAQTQSTNDRCIGMLTFIENPELIAKRNEAVWPASKMVFIGKDKAGRPIRVYYFKGAMV
jgi:hypothetical protein